MHFSFRATPRAAGNPAGNRPPRPSQSGRSPPGRATARLFPTPARGYSPPLGVILPKAKTRREGRRVFKNRKKYDRSSAAIYFCHVRFLWRLDFKRFLRLCLFIFKRRFFFRLPMVM